MTSGTPRYLTPIKAADPALLAAAIAAVGPSAKTWRSTSGELWIGVDPADREHYEYLGPASLLLVGPPSTSALPKGRP